jgi:hypothetical protein
MKIKSLLKFYGVYLPILGAFAQVAVAINRNYIVQNSSTSLLILGITLALPFLVFMLSNLQGAFAKWLRLFIFSIFRVKIFATIGLLSLALLSMRFLFNLLVRHIFEGEEIFLNVFVMNAIFIYFLGLIIYGRFQIRQPSAILLRKNVQLEVYVYQDGTIRHIPDPPTLALLGYSWNDVVEVGNAEFKAYKQKPAIESVTNARLVDCPI